MFYKGHLTHVSDDKGLLNVHPYEGELPLQ